MTQYSTPPNPSPAMERWQRIARRIRVPLGFLTAALYLFELIRNAPRPSAIAWSLVLVLPGLWLRGYASGYVKKNAELATTGPYAHTRNPLYLGSFCTIVAICFVMPPTGALFVLVLIPIFLLRLILSEETFLSSKLGEVYREYLRSTPRLLPRLRSNVAHGLSTPHWGRAVLAELNPIGVFVSVAFLSWRYDNLLIIKAILVSFGVSLVVRAILPAPSDLTVAA